MTAQIDVALFFVVLSIERGLDSGFVIDKTSFQFVPGSMNPTDAQTKVLGATKQIPSVLPYNKQGNLRNIPATTVTPKHVMFDLDRNICR